MTTTATATTTAADPHAKAWAENARIHDLRRAMCARRADPVGGRTRLVRDIAREHGAMSLTRSRVRPRDHARLPARQRGPSPQRARLPGPLRLRRRLARRALQGAARVQGRGVR
jgi:hypothetical protein